MSKRIGIKPGETPTWRQLMKRFILTAAVGFGCLASMTGCVVEPARPVAVVPAPILAPPVVVGRSRMCMCTYCTAKGRRLSGLQGACLRMEMMACQKAHAPRVTLMSFTCTPAVLSARRMAA